MDRVYCDVCIDAMDVDEWSVVMDENISGKCEMCEESYGPDHELTGYIVPSNEE